MLMLVGGGILVLWFGLGEPRSVVHAADDATRVITDSPGYCLQLRLMVEEVVRHSSTPPPWGVAVLTEQGARMCDQGLIRGGITRLRRALMMMREAQGFDGD